ncbi:Hypothetical predicted protein [Lecanosticta acicola]|uniref:Uncharacterized protein n=1 Tax=Lecanosticta acicola TaxID=111012 RepID=A0AAI8Z498_9PEZI|nr:Hypothetical predicted protein [Lecanosticta acicola]
MTRKNDQTATGSKRALEDGGADVEPGPKSSKNTKNTNNEQNGRSPGQANCGATDADAEESIIAGAEDISVDNRPPYEYICLTKPYYAYKDDNEDENEDEEGEEEDEGESIFNKLASNHPDWTYTIMAESWRNFFTNPDNFDMHIYSDWHSWGVFELLEKLLIEFNKAFTAEDLNKMWSVVATLGHWLNHESSQMWLAIDDGEGAGKAFQVVGCALLTALNRLDREGELKPDSRFRDLGFIMALFLKAGVSDPDQYMDWVPKIVSYAKKADIDLAQQGCDGMEDLLAEHGGEEPMASRDSADRWQWAKMFKALSPRGGDRYNILKMPRRERAKHAFDKKDPLKDWSDKDLQEGNLEIAFD